MRASLPPHVPTQGRKRRSRQEKGSLVPTGSGPHAPSIHTTSSRLQQPELRPACFLTLHEDQQLWAGKMNSCRGCSAGTDADSHRAWETLNARAPLLPSAEPSLPMGTSRVQHSPTCLGCLGVAGLTVVMARAMTDPPSTSSPKPGSEVLPCREAQCPARSVPGRPGFSV